MVQPTRQLLALLVLFAASLMFPAAQPASAQVARPVIAFYYPWYEPTDWSSARMSDLPPEKYSGGSDATLKRHIQEAASAGIDALVCAWFGPDEDRINKRCRRLIELAEASNTGLKVAIMPEQAVWASLNSVDGLSAALGVLKRDFFGRPGYFQFRDKPVVFYFNPGSLGGSDTWQAVRDRADPNREQFWFGGTDQFGYLNVYDALYYFDITWEARPGAAMASYANRLKQFNQANGTQKPFIATAMPGYNDLRVRPDGHARDREDGNYYRTTWQTAIERNADAVVITSFNEWAEGSQIEPSQSYGDLYLRLTRELSDKFRAQAGQAAPAPEPGNCRLFPETGKQACGRILEYWQQNGGLPVFGYPISDQASQQIEGKAIQVQLFERNRLELHPENARPYDVLLGRLGFDSLVAQGRDWASFARADAGAPNYFAETGHAIAPEFIGYWRSNGLEFDGQRGKSFAESLALFGLPLSEANVEINPTNGQPYLTQHFERARFEYHPENAGTPYVVLLGLLGSELSGL